MLDKKSIQNFAKLIVDNARHDSQYDGINDLTAVALYSHNIAVQQYRERLNKLAISISTGIDSGDEYVNVTKPVHVSCLSKCDATSFSNIFE